IARRDGGVCLEIVNDRAIPGSLGGHGLSGLAARASALSGTASGGAGGGGTVRLGVGGPGGAKGFASRSPRTFISFAGASSRCSSSDIVKTSLVCSDAAPSMTRVRYLTLGARPSDRPSGEAVLSQTLEGAPDGASAIVTDRLAT